MISKITSISIGVFAFTFAASIEAKTVKINNLSEFRSKVRTIANGDTVVFAQTNFDLSDEDLKVLFSKSNIKIRGNKYKTSITTNRNRQHLIFIDGKGAIDIDGIKFVNSRVFFRNCRSHRFNWSQVVNSRPSISPSPSSAANNLCESYLGEKGSFSWLTGSWSYATVTGKAWKFNKTNNSAVYRNSARGRLRGFIDAAGDGYRIVDNSGQRDSGTRGDNDSRYSDHGIYLNECTNSDSIRNTVKGWAFSSPGGSIKVKNADNIKIFDCQFYRSGIQLRMEVMGNARLTNTYIYGNQIYDGIIDCWTPDFSPKAIRIEDNAVRRGYINASVSSINSSFFNDVVGTAGFKSGGVFNNWTRDGVRLKSGIRNFGNKRF